MPVVTDTNVVQLQAAVSQQWTGIQAAFNAAQLAGKFPAGGAVSEQMVAMNSRVLSFLGMAPSFWNAAAEMNEGEALQRDLNAMTTQLAAAGATDLPPLASVAAPADLFASLQGIGGLVVLIMLLNAMPKGR